MTVAKLVVVSKLVVVTRTVVGVATVIVATVCEIDTDVVVTVTEETIVDPCETIVVGTT